MANYVKAKEFLGTEAYARDDPAGPTSTNRFPFQFKESVTATGSKTPRARFRPPTYYRTTGRKLHSMLQVHFKMKQVRNDKIWQPGVTRTYLGDFPTVDLTWHMPPLDPSLRTALLNQALKGMVDQKFNMLTSIAELRKTCEHLASTASRITGAVRDVRRGRFRDAAIKLGIATPRRASRSRTWAQNWLEYKYGWMPLILDAHGIALHIATMLDREAIICSSRKRSEQRTQETITGASSAGTFRATFRGHIEYTTRYQAVVYYQVDYNSLFNLQRLGLLDPGATAWETVPFSFVVDWFAPVGEWLSLMNAWQGVKFAGGAYTTLTRKRVMVELDGAVSTVNPEPDEFSSTMIRPLNGEVFTMVRDPLRDRPNYEFQLKSPVSFSNVITSIALLRNAFK